jgi:hypothetical protein
MFELFVNIYIYIYIYIFFTLLLTNIKPAILSRFLFLSFFSIIQQLL